uniref:Uncharacterized protein n=1 Tax=viral metagenome TaxID=1070528 RepID=A0A6M3K6E2_9ZZZZ
MSEIVKIRDLLSCWTYQQLQGFLTLHDVLEREGIEFEELKEFITEHKKELVARVSKPRKKSSLNKLLLWRNRGKKCPECGAIMWPYPVNTEPRNQVGGDFKMQLICEHCNNELFLTIDEDQLLKKYGIV